jgi:hypothetical protein
MSQNTSPNIQEASALNKQVFRPVPVNIELVREIIISIFICLYLFYSVTWVSPDCGLKARILEPVRIFWNFWRLDQNWNLYSPVIRDINFHLSAIITFEDGTKMIWQLPTMGRYSLIDRYRMERFRKWGNDVLPWKDKYKEFWPDFARYVGRLFYRPNNKPTKISLHLFRCELPPPKEPIPDRFELPKHWRFETKFTYLYTAKDFQ